MNRQNAGPEVQTRPRSGRSGAIVLALAGGVAIFVFGTPYFELSAATNDNVVYNGVLTAILGAAAWRLRPRANAYADVSTALFVAAAANWAVVIGPFNWLVTAPTDSPKELFQDKLAQFLAVVPVILLLAWAVGRSRRSLYLVRGSPRRWLSIGLPAVLAGAVALVLIARADGVNATALAEAAPWLLCFAAMNSCMEELWFRGVFLQPYTDHMGAAAAIAVTAIVFGGPHIGATYVEGATQIPFGLLVMALGVALAWIIRRGSSIWGGVLFHIGMDLAIALEYADVV
ncbi:MAG: CPBP family intramembrane metalloprotease [Acidimicrobiia bacterium]|nr:CPBP family intramembrane metalloprotease [Acidimicrobiia bacterium]